MIKAKDPFIDEISGYNTILMKLKFICSTAILDMVNNSTETMTFKPEEMIGIVDLRLLGYYKTKQDILQQNLSKYYRFERTDTLC